MKDFKEILEKIAKENGTTPENVLQEMQRAIDEAYDHHDGSAQPLWDMMTFKGDRPTPEEFILQIAMMMDQGNGMLQYYRSSPASLQGSLSYICARSLSL